MLGARVFLSFIPFDLSSPSDMSVWKALFSFTHPTRRTVPKPESSFLAMTPEQRWPIPPEGTKNEAPSAPSPRERYTCEKESEVRSENDSEEEDLPCQSGTYRRDRSPIAEHDPVPRDPRDVSEPNKFLDVLDGVPLRLGDGRAPEQLRVLRVRVVLHPHEDALFFKPSEDGAGVVLLAEHPARRRVRSEVRTVAGRRRLT